jgi:hypothetical protein
MCVRFADTRALKVGALRISPIKYLQKQFRALERQEATSLRADTPVMNRFE